MSMKKWGGIKWGGGGGRRRFTRKVERERERVSNKWPVYFDGRVMSTGSLLYLHFPVSLSLYPNSPTVLRSSSSIIMMLRCANFCVDSVENFSHSLWSLLLISKWVDGATGGLFFQGNIPLIFLISTNTQYHLPTSKTKTKKHKKNLYFLHQPETTNTASSPTSKTPKTEPKHWKLPSFYFLPSTP